MILVMINLNRSLAKKATPPRTTKITGEITKGNDIKEGVIKTNMRTKGKRMRFNQNKAAEWNTKKRVSIRVATTISTNLKTINKLRRMLREHRNMNNIPKSGERTNMNLERKKLTIVLLKIRRDSLSRVRIQRIWLVHLVKASSRKFTT